MRFYVVFSQSRSSRLSNRSFVVPQVVFESVNEEKKITVFFIVKREFSRKVFLLFWCISMNFCINCKESIEIVSESRIPSKNAPYQASVWLKDKQICGGLNTLKNLERNRCQLIFNVCRRSVVIEISSYFIHFKDFRSFRCLWIATVGFLGKF
jgi:hypothetical protein